MLIHIALVALVALELLNVFICLIDTFPALLRGLAEELGFFGAIAFMLLMTLVLWRMLRAAQLARDAYGRLQRLILEQQLRDIDAGRAPGTSVETRRLPRIERDRLKAALAAIGRIDLVVRDALSR